MNAFFAAVLLTLLAPPARAATNDCLFDGICGARPALAAAEETPVPAEAPAAATRLSGLKKGASEGALLGFYAGISPAVKLVEEGFGRRMSRAYDGARSDNGGGGLYYYGGMVIGAILYIPALILGGVGGLFGGAAGAAAPESARKWDAEKFLFDDRKL